MSTENKNTGAAGAAASSESQLQALQQENDSLKQENKNLKAELVEAEKLINEQQKQLSAEPVATIGGDIVVKHGKKNYRVTAKKFRLNGKEYTAESLAKNKELVEQLVKLGSSVLRAL